MRIVCVMEELCYQFEGIRVLNFENSNSDQKSCFKCKLTGKKFASILISVPAMMEVFERIWKCKSMPDARVMAQNIFIFDLNKEKD